MNRHDLAEFHATFVTGAVAPKGFPPDTWPEIAFAGRSNVGKSSLMNRLLGRRKLARVSRTPGRTREVNFFSIGERWMFVDLPGYGYARVGRETRKVWDQALDHYLGQRRALRAVVLLLDLRRGMTDLDQEMMALLGARGLPWLPVATKIDKLKSNARRQALGKLAETLATAPGFSLLPLVAVSSLTDEGMEQLWLRLEGIFMGGEAEPPIE